MEITKIIRLLVGSAGFLITVFLLYLVWRLYAYFYTDRVDKPEKTDLVEIPPENYKAPKYVYNTLTHEFFVTGE